MHDSEDFDADELGLDPEEQEELDDVCEVCGEFLENCQCEEGNDAAIGFFDGDDG